MQEIRKNFIYPLLNDNHDVYGASLLQAPILKEDGDWRDAFAEDELQIRNDVEQSSCYIQAQQHAIEAIEFIKFGEKNKYDARFNALLSGGTETGGDPVAGADSIRHDGMIPEGMMGYDYSTWSEYHSFKGADETHCRGVGNADIHLYSRNFGVVITRSMPLETKYIVLREALKRSPVPISLYGVPDGQGSYIPKSKGVSDTHLVSGLVLNVSANNEITIRDTYTPFIKKLPPNYDMDFGVMWTVEKKLSTAQKKSIWESLVQFFKAFLSPQEAVATINQLQPILMPEVKPEPSKLKWQFPSDARKSVRIICDEMGLTYAEKNLICQVINCESGFRTDARNDNKDGTADWGICQYNTYWYIGKGKPIASIEEAINNPEKCVRVMIKRFKEGGLKDWICYKHGLYKSYTA